MWKRGRTVLQAAVVLWGAGAIGCSPRGGPGQDSGVQRQSARPTMAPAAPVPVHRLTRQKTGSTTSVEQGDFIEIRLDEEPRSGGTWRLVRQAGGGRLEPTAEPVREQARAGVQQVFRFRAVGVGDLDLTFAVHRPSGASEAQPTATFRLVIR